MLVVIFELGHDGDGSIPHPSKFSSSEKYIEAVVVLKPKEGKGIPPPPSLNPKPSGIYFQETEIRIEKIAK